jgi:hypothetical protein
MAKHLRCIKEFSTDWALAVEEIKDFVNLQLTMMDDWEAVDIRLTISRNLVQTNQLRPYIDELRHYLMNVRKSRVVLQSSLEDAHRMELFFRR